MALTVTAPTRKGGRVIMRASADNLFLVPFTFVPTSSYTTSGDAIATADMPSGYGTLVSPWATGGGGPYAFKLDTTNKTLWAYVGDLVTGAHEVTSGVSLQTVLGSSAITIFFYCTA